MNITLEIESLREKELEKLEIEEKEEGNLDLGWLLVEFENLVYGLKLRVYLKRTDKVTSPQPKRVKKGRNQVAEKVETNCKRIQVERATSDIASSECVQRLRQYW